MSAQPAPTIVVQRIVPTVEQIETLRRTTLAALNYMRRKEGFEDWPELNDVVVVAPVLKASTAESFRTARRIHLRKLAGSEAEVNRKSTGISLVCGDPKKCRVCSGKGVTLPESKGNSKETQRKFPLPSPAPQGSPSPTPPSLPNPSNPNPPIAPPISPPQTGGDTDAKRRPQPKIHKQTPAETQNQIQQHRTTLGNNAHLVDTLADLLAAENKTGQVAASRTLRQLWVPIADLTTTMSATQIQYGLQAAITAGAPNANYVKKAAAGYQQRPTTPLAAPQRFSSTTNDEYDRIFGGNQ